MMIGKMIKKRLTLQDNDCIILSIITTKRAYNELYDRQVEH